VTVHLAARMVRDPRTSTTLLGDGRAGVDDALVIGGDETPPLGAYSSAVELLPDVHEHPQRPRTLGIAGYPEVTR
jgi:5,10-methylenetetrahydrofolate reductase